MKSYLIAVLVFCIVGTGVAADFPEGLLGKWRLTHDRSLELMKGSPKYIESQKEMVSKYIKRRSAIMSFVLTESSLSVFVGKRVKEFPFTVVSVSETEVKTKATFRNNKFDLTFKMLDDDYLQVVSSATDDMNFFAWEKK